MLVLCRVLLDVVRCSFAVLLREFFGFGRYCTCVLILSRGLQALFRVLGVPDPDR